MLFTQSVEVLTLDDIGDMLSLLLAISDAKQKHEQEERAAFPVHWSAPE